MKTVPKNLVKNINRIFYEVEAVDYDKRHPEIMKGDFSWWSDIAKQYLTRMNHFSLLDIGSGTGFVIDILCRHIKDTYRIICYDLSPEMLNKAREKLSSLSDVYFIAGDAESLPFYNESIDVICMNSVLHHVPNYPQLLREIDRVLKKKGIFIMAHEPNKIFFKPFLVRMLASVYKILGGRIKISNSICTQINLRLKEEGLIVNTLSEEEIMSMVDYYSPIEQRKFSIVADKGFVPQDLIANFFSTYKILELNEYSTFFYRPFIKKASILSFFLMRVYKIFFRKGNLFSWRIQK
ncbi:MAG: hypothetical protein A2166_02700 [Omnitrophica WOR_2 bacterium RBG_13_41_10]|nr:MAG: hypothetical protein A2166_02700 [Omnitrophica WOR_2 bacterium RBG_13_41_10]